MSLYPKIPSRRILFFSTMACLALSGLFCAAPAAAEEYSASDARTLDFTLQFSRTERDLEAGDDIYPLDFNRITVRMITESYEGMDFGLLIGKTYLSLDNDAPSAGASYNGYHLGLLARQQFGHQPRLTLEAQYLFQQLSADTASNALDLDWHEWQLGANLRFGLGPNLGLIMGAAYDSVDAERRVSGSLNQSLDMQERDNAHGMLGLELLTTGGGRVLFSLRGGGQQGVEFGFSRLF